jgi:alpha-ketoglutarate-dependent taurine dioxygenase
MQITLTQGAEIHPEYGQRLRDIPRDIVVDLVRRQGFILFRGFDPTVAEYEQFTDGFGTCAETRDVHYPDSGDGLGFHAEDAFTPYRPDALWFLCKYAGSDGGIPTGVVDGRDVLNALPEELQPLARTARMRFDRQWDAAVWRDSPAVPDREQLEAALRKVPGLDVDFLPDGTLCIGYETPLSPYLPNGEQSFSNTLMQAVKDQEYYGVTMADGSAVPAELVDAVERSAPPLEQAVGWQTGDVAVIDNLRMMHRRRDYVQVDRDLRARHGEDFFGPRLLPASTGLELWAKSLVTGDVALPTRVGRPAPWGALPV